MTQEAYLSAQDCEYEVRSDTGEHVVAGAAAWTSLGFTAVARCCCSWATSASFGHIARAEAIAHVRRAG